MCNPIATPSNSASTSSTDYFPTWIAPSLEIADLAARFRALHGLRTPDAIQAATAAHTHATGFITNDGVFERLDAFETLVLDRLL